MFISICSLEWRVWTRELLSLSIFYVTVKVPRAFHLFSKVNTWTFMSYWLVPQFQSPGKLSKITWWFSERARTQTQVNPTQSTDPHFKPSCLPHSTIFRIRQTAQRSPVVTNAPLWWGMLMMGEAMCGGGWAGAIWKISVPSSVNLKLLFTNCLL